MVTGVLSGLESLVLKGVTGFYCYLARLCYLGCNVKHDFNSMLKVVNMFYLTDQRTCEYAKWCLNLVVLSNFF